MDKIEIYLSHSWRSEDVALNLLVWDELSTQCLLSVDRQGAALKKNSFFVNRIEYLIRKSDAFVSVLAHRAPEPEPEGRSADDPGSGQTEGSDRQLRCSKASLFELRLAERARKPRLVIYDSRTRFRPPSSPKNKLVRYEGVDTRYELERDGPTIRKVVLEWLNNISERHGRGLFSMRNDVALLLDEQNPKAAEMERAIERGLRDTRFSKLHLIRAHHLDSEIVSMLQSSDLFIAEVGSVDSGVLGIAHALFVPTIRITTAEQQSLPSLLTGHPFGYDRDIVLAVDLADLSGAIRERVSAMDEDRKLLKDAASGRAYLQSKLVRAHKVFISHNLKGDDLPVVQKIINLLNESSINAWEYQGKMASGTNWREKLAAAMKDSTHVLFIASEGFESSAACHQELSFFENHERFTEKHVFPFLWKRSKPLAAYPEVDNPTLPDDSPQRAAEIVAEHVTRAVREA